MSDLYSSTKFGPLYHYRNIRGFMGRSLFFSLIRKALWGSGLFIFLNKNRNIGVKLKEYTIDTDIFKNILFFMCLPDELSILNIMEFVFFFVQFLDYSKYY